MIVGDPVQTHVIPSYQLTVTLPSQEMLDGVGIGAHYRRTGEVFALEHGVRRSSSSSIAAQRGRHGGARGALARRARRGRTRRAQLSAARAIRRLTRKTSPV